MPAIGIVLGSGLGDFAGRSPTPSSIPYGDLPHWPASRVIGHEGTLVVGKQRRPHDRGARRAGSHLYEGHDPAP